MTKNSKTGSRKWTLLIAGISIIMSTNSGFVNVPAASHQGDAVVKLIILDPGHGHATFMQSSMNQAIDPKVHVYAPAGPDVQQYMNSIERANTRKINPTNWKLVVYTGSDYLEKMLADKKGNAVLISGNNSKKSGYITRSIEGGFHVIADKPMAITDFRSLEKSFQTAARKKLVLFDPMDLRYDISNILQKELAQIPELFGSLQKGNLENPALVQANLHHYLKGPAGQTGIRPGWFFDVDQQGHGIVDVSTHLVDLNQWLSFPDKSLNYRTDVKVISSREWPSKLTPSEFKLVTKLDQYPDYLKKDLKDSILSVYSNGEMNYTLKGIHSKVTVLWNYREPPGSSDTHYSLMRGTKADLEIRQDAAEKYRATLFVKPQPGADIPLFEKQIHAAQQKLQDKYPGTEFIKNGDQWEVKPGKFQRTNSSEVAIAYIKSGKMPEWEAPNMIAKYYTTIEALKIAKE
ncbi:putative oxidoreductase C-terminal domain-containing protein [Daejeonella sp.]|uniref:putative oxidoreductase C-terminal domain-containing protein n=1 Tax=Daejeonella sp. TaxID=2805397 RepID=UPI0030C07CDB